MSSINFPNINGRMEIYTTNGSPIKIEKSASKKFNRVSFSAAHVVNDPFADVDTSSVPAIDWDATLSYRRYLGELGLGIAEAMDTAQRGMGLTWTESLELIKRTQAALSDLDVPIFNGAGTDHLLSGTQYSLDEIERAYLDQIHSIQKAGGRIILMASRALAKSARSENDYRHIYKKALNACDKPVILHWLGDMFDPELKGYWGTNNILDAMEVCLEVINDNLDKIDGIKISLLDKDKEIVMRRRLPVNVKMYTGDDFNYPELIAGDEFGYSHALLGIFDAIAPAASSALLHLANGNKDKFFKILNPTIPLSRRIFSAPTKFYKTGVVFMAYLNGHQNHMTMLAGHQSMRPLSYFIDIFKLADQAGLLNDPDMAISRMKDLMKIYGVSR